MRISGIAGTIEYRDTRDGIVIVALISGIAQHYPSLNTGIGRESVSKHLAQCRF